MVEERKRTYPIRVDLVIELLGKRNVTQAELADRTGLDKKTLERTLRGETRPYRSTIELIARFFGVEWEFLVDGRTSDVESLQVISPHEMVHVPVRSEKKLLTDVKLDRDFNDFTKEQQDQFLEGIRLILGAGAELSIRMVKQGSVIVTLELTQEQTDRLNAAFKEGKLDQFGVIGVWLTLPEQQQEDPKLIRTNRLENEWEQLKQQRLELEMARKQLRDDEQSLEAQMRQMEVQMARERALIARKETELKRLRTEIQNKLDYLSRDATIISVMGTRGGVGSTSIAANLAATLAANPENAVALLDLNLAFGNTFDIPGSEHFDFADLVRSAEHFDKNLVRLVNANRALTLISTFTQPMKLSTLNEEQVQRIASLLRFSFSHLVIDMSKTWSSTEMMLMSMSDLILVIVQSELSSLRNAVRLLHTLTADQDLGDRIRIVLNRAGPDNTEGISIKKAEEALGNSVFWQIPNDEASVKSSLEAHGPLFFQSKSRAQQSIQGLADTITETTVQTKTASTKVDWGQFRFASDL